MTLRKVSLKDLIKPIEDPGKNYPLNSKPDNQKYSRSAISHYDWGYYKNKRKSLSYDSPKPFSGSYSSR